MSDYGQSIPPKWFRDTSPKQFTKSAFAAYLHRALVTAGMKEIASVSPGDWDANDPSQDQHALLSGATYMWFYDFPTSETFTFGGNTYRPMFAMACPCYENGSPSASGVMGEAISVQLLYRRSDRLDVTDFRGFNSDILNSTNYGFGAPGAGISLFGGQDGAFRYLPKWVPYTGYTGSVYMTQLQGVQNFHVFLGKGGLLIQVGTGTDKTDNNDLLSFLVLFGGARVPGRARIPNQDINLNRINPTLALPLGSVTDGRYFSTGLSWTFGTLVGNRPSSYVLGMQHDLKFTGQPVLVQMANLENIERPLLPVADIDTKSSPRTLQVGGAHVLVRLEYITWLRAGTTTDFYGPLDPTIRAEPVPSMFDVWTAPGFRVTGRTASIGLYLDPTPASPGPAGIHWFLFRAAGVNTIYAVDAEGVTQLTAFSLPSVSLLTTYHLDLAPGGFSGPFTPSTVMANVLEQGGANWVPTASTDEATLDWNNSNTTSLKFVVSLGALEADKLYKITFELFNKCDAARTAGSASDPVLVDFSADGTSWQPAGNPVYVQGVNRFENTGTNNALPYYAYTTVPPLKVAQVPADGKLYVRFRSTFTNGNDATMRHVGVRNIRVLQYQRA